MNLIHTVPSVTWDGTFDFDARQAAVSALEQGQVIYFPSLGFDLSGAERSLLTPAVLKGSNKNVSFDPATGGVGGTLCKGEDYVALNDMMARYADAAQTLMGRLLAGYGQALTTGRTSFRPARVEGRQTSWRKDDTRLHVDSFPATPTQGRRLLRIFCNVNPEGRPRTWRLGEPFKDLARRYWQYLPAPRVAERHLLHFLRITKGMRSEYDHYMLRLHDTMKADLDYQRSAPQMVQHFPAGSAWACFTDQVSHAAMAGQHQFEQTFYLPVQFMHYPVTSPLRVLENLAGRLAPEGRRAAA